MIAMVEGRRKVDLLVSLAKRYVWSTRRA